MSNRDYGMHVVDQNTIVFGVLIILGITGVILCKYFKLSPEIAIFLPVVIVSAYFIYLISNKIFLNDQAGDNIYYLGFLLTLTGLAVSLYQFYYQSLSAEIIVANFGLSLSGTITGITLRIIYLNFKPDHSQIEEKARRELLDSSQDLSKELSLAADEFKHFRLKIQDDIEVYQTGLQSKIDLFTNSIINKSNEILDKCLNDINDKSSHIQNKMADLCNKFQESMNVTLNKSNEFNIALAKINDNCEKIEIPKNLAKSRIDKIFSGFHDAANNFKVTIDESNDNIKINNAILNEARKLSEQINENFKQLENSTDTIVTLNNNLKNLQNTIFNFNYTLTEQENNSINSIQESVKKAVENFSNQIEKFSEAIKSAEFKFSEASNQNMNNASDFSSHIQTSISKIKIITEKETEILNKAINNLENELKRSHLATEQVVNNFANMTNTIVSKLN